LIKIDFFIIFPRKNIDARRRIVKVSSKKLTPIDTPGICIRPETRADTLDLANRVVPGHFVRHMKSHLRLLLLAGLMVATGGCASKVPKEVFHAGDEVPPDFLTGPAAMLLTNLDGFSATVAFSQPSPAGLPRTVSGDLLEREGRLIFQPADHAKHKKNEIQGGTIFIWDEDRHMGYVLSDPLQAYARLPSSVQGTNVVWETDGAVQEEVDGHPCRRVKALVGCDDGSSARFMVWQAEDAKRLPVRIRSVSGLREFTLDFSNIRLELPTPELFVPPDGFTKYETAVALMNELIIRQTELIKAGESHGTGEETGPAINNWRQGQPQ
jgi:hypothetical protein